MRVNAELSYSLRNYSTEDHEYTPTLGLEDSLNPTFESISVHHIDHEGYCLKKDNDLQVKIKLVGHSYIEGSPLIIKPMPVTETIPPYKVTIKYSMLLPDNFVYVESLLHPAMNVTVRVNAPPDYEVRIGSGKRTPTPSGGYWEYKQLFLAGEYIGVRWFPKSKNAV